MHYMYIYVIYAQVLRCGRTEGHQRDTVTRQGLHRLTCGGVTMVALLRDESWQSVVMAPAPVTVWWRYYAKS